MALRAEDPHYPCSVLDERYGFACYTMQTSVMLWHNGGDIGAAADECLDAPEVRRHTCFQSLGRDISSHTLQDPEASLRECRRADGNYRSWCYVGFVKNLIDLTARTDDGFEFCRRVESGHRPRCYRAIGEQVAVLFVSDEQRRLACAGAHTIDGERSCLEGARLPQSAPAT